jgi:hypothetical protein
MDRLEIRRRFPGQDVPISARDGVWRGMARKDAAPPSLLQALDVFNRVTSAECCGRSRKVSPIVSWEDWKNLKVSISGGFEEHRWNWDSFTIAIPSRDCPVPHSTNKKIPTYLLRFILTQAGLIKAGELFDFEASPPGIQSARVGMQIYE